MKVIILAGGYGSRLGDITATMPKPMVYVGERPILWHIMKIYSYYGIKDFVLCLGYKGDYIKEYFLHYDFRNRDFTVNLGDGSIACNGECDEDDWNVTLVDTGLHTLKGGRIKRIEKYMDDDINLLTYGDGVANININELIEFHKKSGKMVTISGVHPPSRFGELVAEGDNVTTFTEKAQTSQGLINGGFMVFNRKLFDYLSDDEDCDFENGALENLASMGEIALFRHTGLWACMDNERDLSYLENLWKNKQAFWKVW